MVDLRTKMFRSSASFDRLLERATSNLLLEPDWDAILNICDTIRYLDLWAVPKSLLGFGATIGLVYIISKQ